MDAPFSRRRIRRQEQNEDELDARLPQRKVAALYDRIAPVYDLWSKLAESKARKRAIDAADIEDGARILEVAVGTGIAFYEIVKRNPNGVNQGVDLSRGMLAEARKRMNRLAGAQVSLIVGTARELPVVDNSVDLLMNSYMFDLIPFAEMDGIISEFKRVLRKDGRLVLVNMTKGSRLGNRLYETLYRMSPKMMGGCRGVKMARNLRRQGFEVESEELVEQMLFASEVILARK